MTNLTITLDESIVKKARVRAFHEGTSVSAKVREHLAACAQDGEAQQAAAQAFIAAARRRQANRDGARWSREDAYDRPCPRPKPPRRCNGCAPFRSWAAPRRACRLPSRWRRSINCSGGMR